MYGRVGDFSSNNILSCKHDWPHIALKSPSPNNWRSWERSFLKKEGNHRKLIHSGIWIAQKLPQPPTRQPRFRLTPNKFAPSSSLTFKQHYLVPQLQVPGVFFHNHPPPTFTTRIIPSFSNSILPTQRFWGMWGEKYRFQIKKKAGKEWKDKIIAGEVGWKRGVIYLTHKGRI